MDNDNLDNDGIGAEDNGCLLIIILIIIIGYILCQQIVLMFANVFGLGEGAEPKSQIEVQIFKIKNEC